MISFCSAWEPLLKKKKKRPGRGWIKFPMIGLFFWLHLILQTMSVNTPTAIVSRQHLSVDRPHPGRPCEGTPLCPVRETSELLSEILNRAVYWRVCSSEQRTLYLMFLSCWTWRWFSGSRRWLICWLSLSWTFCRCRYFPLRCNQPENRYIGSFRGSTQSPVTESIGLSSLLRLRDTVYGR